MMKSNGMKIQKMMYQKWMKRKRLSYSSEISLSYNEKPDFTS